MTSPSDRSNDRAHIEKQFEDMMDDDWREFRAGLVAREHAVEVTAEHKSKSNRNTNVMAGSSSSGLKEEKNQLTDVITGAISSIFKKGGKNNNNGDDDSNNSNENENASAENMFEGNVGGANTNTLFSSNDDFLSECEDPFLSVEECHLLYGDTNNHNNGNNDILSSNVEINKHRWAHPLGHVESGCVLVANEKLGGVFHQTVVLIIDHHEKIGSTGMIINRSVCF